ncbi:hypothetical protein NIES4071_29790 [Calothrix sp. NIES-4071]|nr:hypothetical protein NIES4071_29790 [Calothrix sp. NIES-4071]BAZ57299.1 hypothetical protein NIES4105_29730 [Calothrix sp. NIES-4105]
MINCNWVFKIGLTAFLATIGVWISLESSAKAQNAGTITINSGNIVLNKDIPTGSITTINDDIPILINNPVLTTNGGDISSNPTNSISNGGNIIIITGDIKIISIPEPDSVGGILAFAATVAVLIRHKRKC